MSEQKIIFSNNPDELMSLDINLHGGVFVIVCESGKMQIEHEGGTNFLEQDDLIVCNPEFLVGHYMRTADFVAKAAFVTASALDDIQYACMRDIDCYWDKAKFIEQHPIIHINEEQKGLLNALAVLISAFAKKKQSRQLSRMYELLGHIASLIMFTWVDEHVLYEEQRQQAFAKRKDLLLHQFLVLLQETRGTEREVSWYASRLNITPKYLSVITLNKFGKTAMQLIQQTACQEIKRLLLETNDSIKEVSYAMNFSSSTFFSKYVHRHFGLPPHRLRRREKQ